MPPVLHLQAGMMNTLAISDHFITQAPSTKSPGCRGQQHPPEACQASDEARICLGDGHYHDHTQYTERVVLQEGRHSVVISCWHRHSSQPVVIKAYTKSTLKARQLLNVQREVKLLQAIQATSNGDGVVTLLAAFEEETQVYLVFKACMRGDLYQLLMKEPTGKLNEQLVANTIVRPLSATLSKLHRMQIVHRDIKPENVFISTDGMVMLGDFGLAARTSDNLDERVGTLDYMAPEVLAMPTPSEAQAGKGAQLVPYDEKVDIWALGCLCYELLVGRPPFEVQDPKETAKLILAGKPAPFPDHLSPACCEFISQALSKSPQLRPSADQLLKHTWLVQGLPANKVGAPATPAPTTAAGLPPRTPQKPPAASAPKSSTGTASLLALHEQQQLRQAAAQLKQTFGVVPPPPSPADIKASSNVAGADRVQSSPSRSAGAVAAHVVTAAGGTDKQQQQRSACRSLADMGADKDDGEQEGRTDSDDGACDGTRVDAGTQPTGLRSLQNRRASSGTSEFLAYNTPDLVSRAGSLTMSASPYDSAKHGVYGGPGRCTASCGGSIETGSAAGSDVGADGSGGDAGSPAWQNGSCPNSAKKAVGKSRFAR